MVWHCERAKWRAAAKRADLAACDCSGGFCWDPVGAYWRASLSSSQFLAVTMCAAELLPECLQLPIVNPLTSLETAETTKLTMAPAHCYGVGAEACARCGIGRALTRLPRLPRQPGKWRLTVYAVHARCCRLHALRLNVCSFIRASFEKKAAHSHLTYPLYVLSLTYERTFVPAHPPSSPSWTL